VMRSIARTVINVEEAPDRPSSTLGTLSFVNKRHFVVVEVQIGC